MNKNLVVLISGNGSNLQAIIDAIENQSLKAKIALVISDKDNAYGLERAKNHGIPTQVISPKHFENREAFDEALLKSIQKENPAFVILAGFMRILGANFIHNLPNKIINIHPSLLPKYPGLHTHEKVLANGDKEHGSTVHLVDESLDGGPILTQTVFSIPSGITKEALEEKIKALEHKLYPHTLQLLLSGELNIKDGVVYFNYKPLSAEGIQLSF